MECVNAFKYLGVKFTNNCKWARQISDTIEKAKFSINQLSRFVRRYEDCDILLNLRLFDAIVVPVLLYGSEIYAWAEGVKGYNSVAHMFYRKYLGLQQGTSGDVLELILGRESIRSRAIRRALIFWRRTIEKDERRLAKEAMEEQSRDLKNSRKNWLNNVEMELNKLGLSYLWMNPRRLGIKKFKKVLTCLLYTSDAADE